MSRKIKLRAFQDNQMLTQPMNGVYAMKRFLGLLYEDTILMQFLGIEDSELKEICESDIVDFTFWTYAEIEIEEHKKGVIECDNLGFLFKEFGGESYYLAGLSFDSTADIKILGNIHLNPELL